MSTMEEAVKAVESSQSKERPVVLGPEFAQVKINKDADACSYGGKQYLSCSKTVKGGYVKMFVFGATAKDIGKTVSGLVEWRLNTIGECDFPYLRVQVVRGERADKKVAFGDDASHNYEAIECDVALKEKEFSFVAGFAPVS